MRTIEFLPKAFEEYRHWIETDRKTAVRVSDLIKDTIRTPFEGIGKPEPLKHEFKGCWSRRIDHEHRLVYQVTDLSVIIVSCYSHYR